MSLATRGKWTDERCDVHWGHLRYLDDLDHIDNDGGGHHVFDIRPVAPDDDRPVLVRDGSTGLRRVHREVAE